MVPEPLGCRSEESRRLLNLFLTEELKITARPADVLPLFPTLHRYSSDQVRGWHNRMRTKAKDLLEKMGGNQQGKRGELG
jgi:hypothetical protein